MSDPASPEDLVTDLVSACVMLGVLLRWGIVALAVSRVALLVAWDARAAELSAWHAEPAFLAWSVLGALAAHGAWAAASTSRHREGASKRLSASGRA